MGEYFKIGDRVQTPTGAIGTIIESNFDFPLHYLVQLTDGTKQHILKRILKLYAEKQLEK